MDYAIMNPPASIRCQADALHFAILTTMKYTCGEGSKVDYDEAKKLYDFFCDNVTAEHIAKVNALEDLNRIYNYNYTKGYPKRLMFTL